MKDYYYCVKPVGYVLMYAGYGCVGATCVTTRNLRHSFFSASSRSSHRPISSFVFPSRVVGHDCGIGQLKPLDRARIICAWYMGAKIHPCAAGVIVILLNARTALTRARGHQHRSRRQADSGSVASTVSAAAARPSVPLAQDDLGGPHPYLH